MTHYWESHLAAHLVYFIKAKVYTPVSLGVTASILSTEVYSSGNVVLVKEDVDNLETIVGRIRISLKVHQKINSAELS